VKELERNTVELEAKKNEQGGTSSRGAGPKPDRASRWTDNRVGAGLLLMPV